MVLRRPLDLARPGSRPRSSRSDRHLRPVRLAQPAPQHPVHRLRADQFLAVRDGRGQVGRRQQERVGLFAAEPAVRADLLLEGVHRRPSRVVRRVDHDVGGVREGVGAAYGLGRARAEGGQRPAVSPGRRAGTSAPPGPSTTSRAPRCAPAGSRRRDGWRGCGSSAGWRRSICSRLRRCPGRRGRRSAPRLPEASTTGSEPGAGCSPRPPPPAGAARRAGRPRARASAPLLGAVRPARDRQPAARPHQVLERQPVRGRGRSPPGSGRGRRAARSGSARGACSATWAISARRRSRRSSTSRRPGCAGRSGAPPRRTRRGRRRPRCGRRACRRSPRRRPRPARRRSRRPG